MQHFLSVFDYVESSFYTLVYGADIPGNEAPVIQYVSDKTVGTGSILSFLVEVSDPNRTIPVVTASPLPSGAVFSLQQSNFDLSTYVFTWTPSAGQEGTYTVIVRADDGQLQSYRSVTIYVTSAIDSDGDGMPDSWEMQYFGSLIQDATTDFDHDGITDLEEYQNGTDPTDPNDPIQFKAHAGQDRSILIGTASVVVGGYPTATGGTPPYTYNWSVSPATTDLDYAHLGATKTNPNFSAKNAGTYTLSLTVTDDDGKQATDTAVEVSALTNSVNQGLQLHGHETLAGCQTLLIENAAVLGEANLGLIAPEVTLGPGFSVASTGVLHVTNIIPQDCLSGQ